MRLIVEATNEVSAAQAASNLVGPVTKALPPVPPTPPAPPKVKKKQSLRPGAAPKRIKPRGITTVNKRRAKTRQGRPLSARVSLVRSRGEVRCLRVSRGKQRLVRVRTYGTCTMRIRVTYTAPGTSRYQAFRQVKTYRVKR